MSISVAAKSVRRDLYDQIASITQDPGATTLGDALQRVETCLEAGECLLASNACESLATLAPNDRRLIQLWALALARSGAASKANVKMESLASSPSVSSSTCPCAARLSIFTFALLAAPDRASASAQS